MMTNLISIALTIGIVALIAWRVFGGRGDGIARGQGIRRFFQYGVQYLLLVISAVGASGLISRALGRSTVLTGGQSDLALDIAFTVVGVPLFVTMALWTRRLINQDASEVKSLAWAIASTATTLTALGVAMYATFNVGLWVVGINEYDGFDLAQLLVWGVVLVTSWTIDRAYTPIDNGRPHLFLGSAVGLLVSSVAIANTLTAAFELLLRSSGQTIYSDNLNPLWRGLVLAAIGIPVWALYWFENALPTKRDALWYGYVLLLGTAGGFIASIASASTVLYRGLVWLVGDPTTTSAAIHFRDVPAALAVTLVGAGIWWYHQGKMATPGPRNEIDRVFDYSMSGIGLVATGVGIGYAVIAVIEGITSATVLTGGSVTNALLLATTLLVVGTPVWTMYWARIGQHVIANRSAELAAPTRRAYLFLLFGVGGIAAIISLVTGVYLFADDLLATGLSSNTFYRMRYALAVLISAAGVAGYHWMIYDDEREAMRAQHHGPHYVLLIGPKDDELEHQIGHMTGGRVHHWTPTNGFAGTWTHSAVLHEVATCKDDTLIMFAEGSRLLAVPVHRD